MRQCADLLVSELERVGVMRPQGTGAPLLLMPGAASNSRSSGALASYWLAAAVGRVARRGATVGRRARACMTLASG